MGQKFYASRHSSYEWPNGAIGHSAGTMNDCLGPYAVVRNCPIEGTALRLTCYATGYADTWFSIPASTRRKGKHVRGYFTLRDDGVVFVAMDSHKERLA